MARAVEKLRLPIVDLRGFHCPAGGVALDTDAAACARLAADHFLERGFRNFAFCGFPGSDFSDRRCVPFVAHLVKKGHEVSVYEPVGRGSRGRHTLAAEADGELCESHVAKWLRSLARPAAVFACNDVRARQVLAACGSAGLSVPDEIAVLGVDDDPVICGLSNPPLSSIRPDAHGIGYRGAAILDELICGTPVTEAVVLIPPRGIAVRLSTDVLALEDRGLAGALRFIREHACENIGVEDVARARGLSRATLERRFSQALGRSPAAEIERVRMQRAKHLLSDTDYKLMKIALMTGYSTAAHFATAFKRHAGCTAGAFRLAERRLQRGPDENR